jgi:glycosyltransferase involved in cell wall biosynthesis
MAAKSRPPVLLYAGATPRGIIHMPVLLDHLRVKQNDFTVEMYCKCAPSRDPKANDEYLNRMRALPHVTHAGMVGQRELLRRMKRAALMVSPNPWPETSCITLMEAMAAGLSAVTTNRAALPETAAGFARHVALDDADHPTRFDMPLPYEQFAQAISAAMDEWTQDPADMEQKLRAQIMYFKAHYQWGQRVQPWLEFLLTFDQERHPATVENRAAALPRKL